MSDQEAGPVGSAQDDGGQKRSLNRGTRVLLWILGILVLIAGAVFFVMFGPPHVAEQFAEPKFCGSCHEMDPWLVSFRQEEHGGLESCNDCHLPHGSTLEYYFWEGVVGVRDLAKHSVGAIPQPIEAGDRTRSWIQENCRRCHDDEIEDDHGETRAYCWECHDEVFHRVSQQGGAQLSDAWLVLKGCDPYADNQGVASHVRPRHRSNYQ